MCHKALSDEYVIYKFGLERHVYINYIIVYTQCYGCDSKPMLILSYRYHITKFVPAPVVGVQLFLPSNTLSLTKSTIY